MKKTKFFETTKKLEERNILHRVGNGKNIHYYVNPSLFYKGTRITKALSKMFDNFSQ